MRTYISEIIPKIQRFSEKLDNLSLLTNQHWVVIDEIEKTKNVYIFRHNNELLISQNGIVEKAKWEYLGNNSLLIDKKSSSYLFKQGFFDKNILALKIDSKNEYAFLVNETKYNNEINTLKDVLNFLENKYLIQQNKNNIKIDVKEKKTMYLKESIPKYIESESVELYNIMDGKHYEIKITFDDNKKGLIYIGGKSKKYFLKYSVNGILYFDSKNDCIKYLYEKMCK